MQLITYFVFTLVSILIQFCVIDFINASIEDEKYLENASTVQKKRDLQAIASKLSDKPHALFYRTDSKPVKLYDNVSLSELTTTTEISSSILDWVYDENITTTEDTILSTDLYTSTEVENITEITLFDKTTTKPKTIPKKTKQNEICYCNILYKICDINCCCDNDCSQAEMMLFNDSCKKESSCHGSIGNLHFCLPDNNCSNKMTPNFLENLFCISKSNLPDKRLTDIQFDEAAFNRSPKWHKHERQKALNEFKNTVYIYKEPVWIYKNGSLLNADIPITIINNYCSGKKPIEFLVEENTKCIVKFQDLHMFQVFHRMEEATVISVRMINSSNATVKNTSIHHTNWTLYSCDELQCATYNKSRHEPFCTDSYCNNIATAITYDFYYYNSTITEAVIKLHTQDVSLSRQFILQNIKVNFYLSNTPKEKIIKLSGNPGYIFNLPVIKSTAENNHTIHFFNSTSDISTMLTYPESKDGKCVLSNVSYKIVLFGQNKRSKCRFYIKQDLDLSNATRSCQSLQNRIFEYLELNTTVYISPYGNPQKNSDWLKVKMFDKYYVYGTFDKNGLIHCYNIVTRIAYIIAYVDTNSETSKGNKILHANIEGTAQNVTFNIDDISAVLTVDAGFVDASRPAAPEYAGAPHLNVHLPKSFFLPSHSGGYLQGKMNHLTLIMLCPCIRRLI